MSANWINQSTCATYVNPNCATFAVIEVSSFNPAEAEVVVSIQPKPKKGSVALLSFRRNFSESRFKPAKAEDGFRRKPIYTKVKVIFGLVSLTAIFRWRVKSRTSSSALATHLAIIWLKSRYLFILKGFNPAEAEEGFRREPSYTIVAIRMFIVSIQPKPKKGLEGKV